jgi:hypothetical protein
MERVAQSLTNSIPASSAPLGQEALAFLDASIGAANAARSEAAWRGSLTGPMRDHSRRARTAFTNAATRSQSKDLAWFAGVVVLSTQGRQSSRGAP